MKIIPKQEQELIYFFTILCHCCYSYLKVSSFLVPCKRKLKEQVLSFSRFYDQPLLIILAKLL